MALQAQMKREQLSTDGLAGILASTDQSQGKKSVSLSAAFIQFSMKQRDDLEFSGRKVERKW